MDQWMSFGGASGPSAWEFGWNALAAIGALFAAVAALGMHFHQQRVMRKAEERRQQLRTEAIAPQLAADVMRLNWQIAQSIRWSARASKLPLEQRTAAMLRAWGDSAVQLVVIVGETTHSGDIEWVTDDVRLRLAALKAQVSVTNAMWQRLLQGPVEPFATREEAIGEMMKQAVHQVVDTNLSAILLLKALDPYLPEMLRGLVVTMEREQVHFETAHKNVPYQPRVQKPAAG